MKMKDTIIDNEIMWDKQWALMDLLDTDEAVVCKTHLSGLQEWVEKLIYEVQYHDRAILSTDLDYIRTELKFINMGARP